MAGAAVRTRFPGPVPYGDDPLSRKLFCGREQESLALTNQVIAHRLVVFFARSGLGKTSLLRAAVAHHLREEGFAPLIVHLGDRVAGPIASIYKGIEAECALRGISYDPGDQSSLWSFFKTAELWDGDTLLEPVLVIDQFENLFNLYTDGVRDAFIDQLSSVARGVAPAQPAPGSGPTRPGAGALNDSPPRLRVVLSLREDSLPRLEELAARIPEILAERFRLLPLTRAQAARAIEQPGLLEDERLETPPFELEGQAREAILGLLEHRKAAAPWRLEGCVEPFQLQLVCQHVERAARQKAGASGGRVTVSLEELGGERGLHGILMAFYQRQLAAIPSILERARARALCSQHLISLHGRRLRLEESEIRRMTGTRPRTLRNLVDARLLRVTQVAAGCSYYELSHDSLIDAVVQTRRNWFCVRAVMAAVGLVTGVLMVGLLAVQIAGGKDAGGTITGEREKLLLVYVAILILLALYLWRTFPLAREMWRRSMM